MNIQSVQIYPITYIIIIITIKNKSYKPANNQRKLCIMHKNLNFYKDFSDESGYILYCKNKLKH